MIAEVITDLIRIEPRNTILVIGPGSKADLARLANLYPNQKLVAVGFKKGPDLANLSYRNTIFPTLPFPSEHFEDILVLDAARVRYELLAEVVRVLKPGGNGIFIQDFSFKKVLARRLFPSKSLPAITEESLHTFLCEGFPTPVVVRTENYLVGIGQKTR